MLRRQALTAAPVLILLLAGTAAARAIQRDWLRGAISGGYATSSITSNLTEMPLSDV